MTATTCSSADGRAMPDATLPEGCNSPFDLLRAAKRAGRRYGLGPQDLQLLELYLCFTRREDWAQGRRPLYTRSVLRTAASLGVSPRSVNTAERRLERLGLIHRATRADGARGGWDREEGGALYGIDLTPLIAAQCALQDCADAARAEADEAERLRAALSRLLGEARRLAMTATGATASVVASLLASLPARTPQGRNPSILTAMLETITPIVDAIRAACPLVDNSMRLPNSSDAPEESSALLYTTINPPETSGNSMATPSRNAGEKDGANSESAHGLAYLKPHTISRAMPDAWHDMAGTVPGQFLWHRFTMAAQGQLKTLGVAPAVWLEAVAVMGEKAASVSLMVLDANRFRPVNPVRNVTGALRGMVRRAETGGLRLHASVYGLAARAGDTVPC